MHTGAPGSQQASSGPSARTRSRTRTRARTRPRPRTRAGRITTGASTTRSGGPRVDWFSDHAPLWERFVAGTLLARAAGRDDRAPPPGTRSRSVARVVAAPPMRGLVVGAYEGLPAAWLLDHLLTHPDSRLTVVERFRQYDACAQYEGRGVWNPPADVRATFEQLVMRRPDAAGGRVELLDADEEPAVALMRLGMRTSRTRTPSSTRASASSAFRGTRGTRGSRDKGGAFDVVYVDATGGAADTLEQAVLAFRLVRPGGVLVLTNYTHSREHDARCPRRGIDAFLDAFTYEARVLHSAWHVFVQRRPEPLPRPPCLSEYYDPHPPPGECARRSAASTAAMRRSASAASA